MLNIAFIKQSRSSQCSTTGVNILFVGWFTHRTMSRKAGRICLNLMTYSTHFIYGYMASDIWLRTIQIAREETRCQTHRLLLLINSKGSFICTIPHTGQHTPWPLLHQSWSTGWNDLYREGMITFYCEL